ncbi:branched chain amino acid ABC transporter periplasmic ligand-binding protein [Caballeronia glebae]|uniref:Branched chain amino acid ABC transporter periplasmic ligand-binding protein n=1 Tax=Caballeronia glebae TaxID=1777143 RepID=A0A158D0L7_9BURK|nr:branched chain amino acid ABC transporter periplasmic ligand-binding protein [Caballeronia glebae]
MTLRADDHQVIQPLYVIEMDKAGTKGVAFDNEGSGYGFRTLLHVPAEKTAQPTTCRMSRPTR